MFKTIRTTALVVALGVTAQANAVDIAMETATAASVVGLMPQTMASHWGQAGVNVQLNMGQTLTKSLLKVASGDLDSAIIPTPAFYSLQGGKGPYAQLGEEKGAELASNVKGLFGFPASYYHAITWADSGINTWADAAGKRVYIGPPAGAANAQIKGLAAAGGLEAGTYEEVKAPWGTAAQAFQDGQFDVYVGSFGLGSQAVAEISLQRSIRILGVADDKTVPPKALGMAPGVIPAGTYPGQANEADANTYQTMMFVGVPASMSDDVAYTLTKTYFESTATMAQNNALLKHLEGADPFGGLAAPVHPGAAKYYAEQGIEIPEDLR